MERRRRIPMFFCERAFSVFFLLWGSILILNSCQKIGQHGIFIGQLESYLPSWGWGTLIITLALGRTIAYYKQSRRARLLLSFLSFLVLTIVAAISIYSRLWSATAPLALFCAYFAYWCHKSLLQDLRR